MSKVNIKRLIVIVFLIVVAIITTINIRGSYLQYKELGENYIPIFETKLKYNCIIFGINFVAIFLITYFTTRGIKKGLKVFFDEEKKEMPKLPNKSISLIISVILSFIVAIVFTDKIILSMSNASFEKTDMVFGFDISFYMFIEPLIKASLIYIICILVGLIIYSALYYVIIFNKYFDGVDKDTLKRSTLVKHIITYVRIVAIVFALYSLVCTLDLVFHEFLTTDSGIELTGAGITDITIRIWGNIILSIVITVSIFVATHNFKNDKRNKILGNLLIIPGYMVVMFVAMLGFDLLFVNSNEYDKEEEYIERNISYTQNAYGIDCEEEIIEYSGTITSEELEENENIINNIVTVDSETILENLNDEQTGKGYYTYSSAGISKYFNKETNSYQLVYMSPREIVNSKRTYNSKTFEYTHGYGIIITSATSMTEDGNIEYIENSTESSDISTPQIYYGLETDNTVVTNTSEQIEYDYTDSKGTEYTTSYEGDSGISLGFLDRLILGIKTGNIKLAFSSDITSDSKILINRNIIERAKKALSEVLYDENPYTVIDENGDIYWVLDAYTISSNYPYSTYTTIEYDGSEIDINYIRNSIKVIINAYDGSMKFYITDTTDPIAMAYRNMYPTLFEDLDSEIPESISSNFVYPQFLYEVQAEMLEEYHNIKSEVLYRGDDSWDKSTYSNSTVDAYYTMIEDGDEEKIGLIQFYTPSGKQNLTSYLVGTVDENGTNKLKLCTLSSSDTILGLTQLDSKILQDEDISSEIEALEVTGAKVTKEMIVIPIEDTLLYVELVYQTKTNETNVPILKKVIVASGNKVAIGDDLQTAIENLVSQDATSIDTYTTEDIDGLIQSIIKANQNLTQSMDSNDWELMGTDVKTLQELIDLLEEQVELESDEEEDIEEETSENENVTDENTSEN